MSNFKKDVERAMSKHQKVTRKLPESVEQVDELSTKLLKRYDRKNATSGANLRKKMDKTIATVRKSGSGVATPKQAARFTKALDKHSNRMDGADRSQQIQLKRAQKESVSDTGWKKATRTVTDKSGAKHDPMSKAKNAAKMGLKQFINKNKK
jgi:hypothetical protein